MVAQSPPAKILVPIKKYSLKETKSKISKLLLENHNKMQPLLASESGENKPKIHKIISDCFRQLRSNVSTVLLNCAERKKNATVFNDVHISITRLLSERENGLKDHFKCNVI